AGMELTASGGGSFLKLDPGGVTFSGATIKLNSGGAAAGGQLPGLHRQLALGLGQGATGLASVSLLGVTR
ncbi:hypothetical protein R0G64_32125, partial [Pseudomonas otitidis]